MQHSVSKKDYRKPNETDAEIAQAAYTRGGRCVAVDKKSYVCIGNEDSTNRLSSVNTSDFKNPGFSLNNRATAIVPVSTNPITHGAVEDPDSVKNRQSSLTHHHFKQPVNDKNEHSFGAVAPTRQNDRFEITVQNTLGRYIVLIQQPRLAH